MRGVLLAGGTGSRLLPLTRVTNKHLLPVGREPMIFHPLRKLVSAGMTEICVVTGTEHMGDVVRLLGSGREHGCDLTFRVQDAPGGIAQALALAEGFSRGGRLCALLGDNVFEDDLVVHAREFALQQRGARVLLKEVSCPERFGVAEVEGNRILSIEEKPVSPRSSLAVVGVYFYDADVFDIIRTCRPSARGEFEITDVNRTYLRRGDLSWGVLRGYWTDAGTHESLEEASRLVQVSR